MAPQARQKSLLALLNETSKAKEVNNSITLLHYYHSADLLASQVRVLCVACADGGASAVSLNLVALLALTSDAPSDTYDDRAGAALPCGQQPGAGVRHAHAAGQVREREWAMRVAPAAFALCARAPPSPPPITHTHPITHTTTTTTTTP